MIAMRSPSALRNAGSRDIVTSWAITGTVASISW